MRPVQINRILTFPQAVVAGGHQQTGTDRSMGDKNKSLCKWKSSQYVKELDRLKILVKDPRFICKDCGRAAHDKKSLCKPVKLD